MPRRERMPSNVRDGSDETTDFETALTDFLTGHNIDPVRAAAFNTAERLSQDVSEAVAHELCRRCDLLPRPINLRQAPHELPPEVAEAFVQDMRAYFKAVAQNKRDEIAARQRSALREFQGPRDKALRLTDVIKMFNEMKDVPLAMA